MYEKVSLFAVCLPVTSAKNRCKATDMHVNTCYLVKLQSYKNMMPA